MGSSPALIDDQYQRIPKEDTKTAATSPSPYKTQYSVTSSTLNLQIAKEESKDIGSSKESLLDQIHMQTDEASSVEEQFMSGKRYAPIELFKEF